jgi:hypothetical protein
MGIDEVNPLSLNEEKDDAAREAYNLTMAGRNSCTTVVTDVWEKAKRAREADKEEARDIRWAKRVLIRSEMALRNYVIADYLGDNSDFSDEDTDDDDILPPPLPKRPPQVLVM